MARPDQLWQASQDLWVNVVSPTFGQIWVAYYRHDGVRDPRLVPAGTRFSPPQTVRRSPPVGAYPCQPDPDDGSDVEDWLHFTLLEPAGAMAVGAVVECRPTPDLLPLIRPTR